MKIDIYSVDEPSWYLHVTEIFASDLSDYTIRCKVNYP